MSDVKMAAKNSAFLFVDQLVKAAIKAHINIEGQWEIEKRPFEDEWITQPLHEAAEETYGLQVSNAIVEVDFAYSDDIESLTNCYVTFDVTGTLAEVFRAHGLRTRIVVDIFNSAVGSCVALLSEEDVDDQVSLLDLWIDDPNKLVGFMESLTDNFASFV